ncbi:hypothetical protein HIM_09458 [Hirsutella minnesotensis 3608]|uniref:Uncharacterized protein n=1 Tax=Hirsutella minnesotensis 3608 TaxID=1043627 RepID=A0A0F8A339_9HYPO|nr:hypothetical protein HIM_09458 [Hirsutella minnesotensis 3608]
MNGLSDRHHVHREEGTAFPIMNGSIDDLPAYQEQGEPFITMEDLFDLLRLYGFLEGPSPSPIVNAVLQSQQLFNESEFPFLIPDGLIRSESLYSEPITRESVHGQPEDPPPPYSPFPSPSAGSALGMTRQPDHSHFGPPPPYTLEAQPHAREPLRGSGNTGGIRRQRRVTRRPERFSQSTSPTMQSWQHE